MPARVRRPRLQLSCALACLLVPSLLVPNRARAESPAPEPIVAIAGLELGAGLSEAARQLFERKLAEGLRAARLAVVEAQDARSCDKPACFREQARARGAAFVVTGRIAEEHKNYDVALELWNGHSGQSAGSLTRRCQICGLTEAADRLSLAASALAERIHAVASEPARIVIRATPASAQVSVNGQPRGVAPIEVDLGAGTHRLALRAPGYRPLDREITVVPGVDHSLDLQLLREGSDFAYRTYGYAALATGAALIATGVVLLALHGSEVGCRMEEKDADGDCPRLYMTSWLAGAALATGAAAATLGGVWLYLDRPREGELGGAAPAGVSLGLGWRGRM